MTSSPTSWSSEDDAQRAVRLGLGLVEAMEALKARLQRVGAQQTAPLQVRLDVHTGLVGYCALQLRKHTAGGQQRKMRLHCLLIMLRG
jgi:hypothetical protein